MLTRRTVAASLIAAPLVIPRIGEVSRPASRRLIAAARAQIGVTTSYDPAYVRLAYPGGDVPVSSGVCIDVVVRAYRDAFNFDFQKAIHEDMGAHFAAYPAIWGLSRPDRNIDHRRVPNMETWLKRYGHERPDTRWMPGDLMSCRVPRNLPHIAIVSDRRGRDGHWRVIHNIGGGTREESLIDRFGEQRRFRFLPVPV